MFHHKEKIAKFFCFHSQKRITPIDDYTKDGRPEAELLLCSFYHHPLRALKYNKITNVHNFAF